MSDENNRRYIGEVFIDGKSDKLLQEFLTNLFNSYIGHGKGFDADMVDGYHLQDILDYVNEHLDTKLSYITIGQTTFTPDDPEKFLQLLDIIYDEFKSGDMEAPWIDYIRSEGSSPRQYSTGLAEDEHYLLSDMLLDLYHTINMIKADNTTVNSIADLQETLKNCLLDFKAEYNDFKKQFDGVFQEVTITDTNGNQTTQTFLNAEMINGFRIIPITQQNYDTLPTEEQNCWRNIYIIRDQVDDDYLDPVSYHLLKEVKIVYNPETKYIEYYDGVSDTPKQLISLEDLFALANINDRITNYLTQKDDIIYNITSIKNTLKELIIHQNEQEDFPFITRDEGKALVSSIESDYGSVDNHLNANNHQTYDITHAFDNKFSQLDNVIRTLNELSTQIQDTNTAVNQANATFYDKTYINERFSLMQNQVTDIRNSVNSLSLVMKKKTDRRNKYLAIQQDQSYNENRNPNGIYLSIKGDIAIFHFNNPAVRFNRSSGWNNIVPPSQFDSLSEFNIYGAGEGDGVPEIIYGHTSFGFLLNNHSGCRIRFKPENNALQVYIESEWVGNNNFNHLGWGQLVVPLDDSNY